nr:poly(rC)-binding protein 3/4 [Halisarca dujardinii]
MSAGSTDSDGSGTMSVNGTTAEGEDGLNESVCKILDMPRSPIVSESFALTTGVPSSLSENFSPSSTQEAVSTRAISPPSTVHVVTTVRANGYHSNGMIPDPTYQELCEQLITLGVAPSSPEETAADLGPLNRLRSPSPTNNGSICSIGSPPPVGGGGVMNGHAPHCVGGRESPDGNALTLRVLMSGKDTGSVIGKGGSFIKSVRERSGARINISSDSFSSERLVTISGSIGNIHTGFMMMATKLENDGRQLGLGSSPPPTPLIFRLVIPTSQCGCLIGRAGTKIKEIREVSGANIQISGEALPNSSERAVTLSGSLSTLSTCVKQICHVMMESPPKGPIQQYSPPPANQLSRTSQLAGVGSPGASPYSNGNTPNLTMSQQMKIPNDLIGCIIGRKGIKINEIRMRSRAQIKISSNEGDLVDRTVTITGDPEAVSTAQYLISSRIQSEVNGLASFGVV